MASEAEKRREVTSHILKHLRLIYPMHATIPLLQGDLLFFGYNISLEQTRTVVSDLEKDGFVFTEPSHVTSFHRSVTLVKITHRGVERIKKEEK